MRELTGNLPPLAAIFPDTLRSSMEQPATDDEGQHAAAQHKRPASPRPADVVPDKWHAKKHGAGWDPLDLN